LGFAIIPLIHFTSDNKLMDGYAIKTWVKVLAWLSAIVIISLNVKLVIDEIGVWIKDAGDEAFWIYFIVIPIAIAVGALLVYIIVKPFISGKNQHEKAFTPHGEAVSIDKIGAIEYKNIGIAIDFSPNDETIIKHAVQQGGKDATYTLIHIVETAGANYHKQNVLDLETISDEDNLKKYQDNLSALGYRSTYKIGYGSTSQAISKIVNDSKIDFLVLGAHGHKGFKDLFFGSTVDAVRHNVNIPVLIVRK
ncbi:iron/manganese transporter, partial [Pseudoxanthomonas sp. SGD-10]